MATIVIAMAAVFVAVGQSIVTLKRDRVSRAMTSHEHWIESFFKLDFTIDRPYPEREALEQELKTRMGTYTVHLLLIYPKLADPLRTLASDIRKVYEVATRVLAEETEGYLDSDELELAKNFLDTEKLRRTYRSYVSNCASTVAEVYGKKTRQTAGAKRLEKNHDRFKIDFGPLLNLHTKFVDNK